LSYAAQCEAKFEMLRGSLQAAKFGKDVLSALVPLVPSQELNYRRRVTLHVDGSGRIGLYRSRSRSIVPIESCSVATPRINDALSALSLFGAELPSKKLSSILLEEDDQGLVAILKSPYDLTRSEVDVILEKVKRVFPNLVLIAAGKEVGGAGRQILELPLNDKKTFFLRLPAGYFSQVNWNINLSLIKRVVEAARLSYGDKVYDLYAGAGNFTLPLARAGGQVTAVECDSRLAGFGRDNIKRHNLEKKVLFLEQSVEQFLKDKAVFKDVSLIIADPPRSGLGNLLPQLNFSQRFLLISCHLPSFVRDLRGFAEMGWTVDSIEPFDMFPQTSYLEILAVLSKH
jgi:23S rRNA (uracil1939-C5)-methyltransferase